MYILCDWRAQFSLPYCQLLSVTSVRVVQFYIPSGLYPRSDSQMNTKSYKSNGAWQCAIGFEYMESVRFHSERGLNARLKNPKSELQFGTNRVYQHARRILICVPNGIACMHQQEKSKIQ